MWTWKSRWHVYLLLLTALHGAVLLPAVAHQAHVGVPLGVRTALAFRGYNEAFLFKVHYTRYNILAVPTRRLLFELISIPSVRLIMNGGLWWCRPTTFCCRSKDVLTRDTIALLLQVQVAWLPISITNVQVSRCAMAECSLLTGPGQRSGVTVSHSRVSQYTDTGLSSQYFRWHI